MKDIERVWFKKQAKCADPSSVVSSDSFGLDSFWGLFSIAVGFSLVALLVYVVIFWYKEHDTIADGIEPGHSLWERICVVFSTYNKWDSRSFTYRNNGLVQPENNPNPAEAPVAPPPPPPPPGEANGAPNEPPPAPPARLANQPPGDIQLPVVPPPDC